MTKRVKQYFWRRKVRLIEERFRKIHKDCEIIISTIDNIALSFAHMKLSSFPKRTFDTGVLEYYEYPTPNFKTVHNRLYNISYQKNNPEAKSLHSWFIFSVKGVRNGKERITDFDVLLDIKPESTNNKEFGLTELVYSEDLQKCIDRKLGLL